MDNQRFCKDCRWIDPQAKEVGYAFADCQHPELSSINMISGKKKGTACALERVDPNGKCGPDGWCWEAKS